MFSAETLAKHGITLISVRCLFPRCTLDSGHAAIPELATVEWYLEIIMMLLNLIVAMNTFTTTT